MKEKFALLGVVLICVYVFVNVPEAFLIFAVCALVVNEICRLAARNEIVFKALKKAGILYGKFPNRRVGFLESWRMIFRALTGQTVSWD